MAIIRMSILITTLLWTAQAQAGSVGVSIPRSTIESTESQNYECIQPVVIGTCPYTELPLISYYLPYLIVETTNKNGNYVVTNNDEETKTSTIDTKSLAKKFSSLLIDSGHGSQTSEGTYIKFYETRVHDISVQTRSDIEEEVCGYSLVSYYQQDHTSPLYESEVDTAWRIAELDFIGGGSLSAIDPSKMLKAQIGNWGSLYSRSGHIINSHNLIAAAVTSFRAIDITTDPGVHTVNDEFEWGASITDNWHYYYPIGVPTCEAWGYQSSDQFAAGKKPSDTGQYIWVQWKHHFCCGTY